MCFSAAVRCGVSVDLYTRYLAAQYHTDVDNVPVAALAAERQRFEGADAARRLILKAEIIRAVNAALKRKAP